MPRPFQETAAFGINSQSYHLLPFRFIRLDQERKILVSESGELLVAPVGTAEGVVRRTLDVHSDLYPRLPARHFLFDDQSSPLLDVLATNDRTKKSFLDGFTKLHIFVVTSRFSLSGTGMSFGATFTLGRQTN